MGWDDEGEAEEEEEADEDQDVGREEGAPQVSVMGDKLWGNTKWCAESSCNSECKCSKQGPIAVIFFVPPCNIKHNDAVDNDKDGDWDDGVELHEGSNQREAHHSHQSVREDKNHALQCLSKIALNFK